MKLGVIVGSPRKNSQSARLGKVLRERLAKMEEGLRIETFDLAEISVPLWSEEKWNPESAMSKTWSVTGKKLRTCSGFVVITPEWGGMVTPHLKNFLLMCDSGELAHKPALIVSVSAGINGAYPVSELRMSGYKNTFVWWLPDHLIFRNAAQLFGEDEPSRKLLERTDYSLKFLLESSKALAPVRESVQNLKDYVFGM